MSVSVYQVALNGVTVNSYSHDHVWAVVCVCDSGVFLPNLTHAEATAKAAELNAKR
jgi:hypothetical protein